MNIFYYPNPLPKFQHSVLTIGSFDGVHWGHQHILKRLCTVAQQIGGQSIVITFHPHPRAVVANQEGNPLQLIQTLEEKAHWLERCGVDVLVVVPFNKEFAALSPDEYIEQFLVKQFAPRYIIIGYDHRFGKGRIGDIHYLKNLEHQYGYTVEEISPQDVETIVVSSSKIRKALTQGDVAQAAKLMGHAFQLTGKVVKGLQLGTQIGFPTANLEIQDKDKLVPPEGIYAVKVHYQDIIYLGMLYIGRRPTLDNNLEQTIEVNIFDFDQHIYNQTLVVDLITFLREDIRFSNLEALQAQLAADKQAALSVLTY